MSMYGKYPKVSVEGVFLEQNGLNGAPKAWPVTDFKDEVPITVQAQKNETNINTIMKNIEKGRMVDMVENQGLFADISQFDGLEHAIIMVQNANAQFMELNADIRQRFDNDPVKLIEFLENPENREEAIQIGLIDKNVEVVDDKGGSAQGNT